MYLRSFDWHNDIHPAHEIAYMDARARKWAQNPYFQFESISPYMPVASYAQTRDYAKIVAISGNTPMTPREGMSFNLGSKGMNGMYLRSRM